jgi:hypothetical protein
MARWISTAQRKPSTALTNRTSRAYDATAVFFDLGFNELNMVSVQLGQDAFIVDADQAAVPSNIRHQDCHKSAFDLLTSYSSLPQAEFTFTPTDRPQPYRLARLARERANSYGSGVDWEWPRVGQCALGGHAGLERASLLMVVLQTPTPRGVAAFSAPWGLAGGLRVPPKKSASSLN